MNSNRKRCWDHLQAWADSAGLSLSELGRAVAVGVAQGELSPERDTVALVEDWASGIWDCPDCDERYASWQALNRHRVAHTPRPPEAPPQPCPSCGRQLRTSRGLRSHIGQAHRPVVGAWQQPAPLPAPPGLAAGRTPRGEITYYIPVPDLSTDGFRELAFDLFEAAGWYPDDDAVFVDDRPLLADGDYRFAAGVIKLRRGAPGYFNVLSRNGYPGWAAQITWDEQGTPRLQVNPSYRAAVPPVSGTDAHPDGART